METMKNIPSNLDNATSKDSFCQCYVTFEPLLCQKAYKFATFLNLVLLDIPKQATLLLRCSNTSDGKTFAKLAWCAKPGAR